MLTRGSPFELNFGNIKRQQQGKQSAIVWNAEQADDFKNLISSDQTRNFMDVDLKESFWGYCTVKGLNSNRIIKKCQNNFHCNEAKTSLNEKPQNSCFEIPESTSLISELIKTSFDKLLWFFKEVDSIVQGYINLFLPMKLVRAKETSIKDLHTIMQEFKSNDLRRFEVEDAENVFPTDLSKINKIINGEFHDINHVVITGVNEKGGKIINPKMSNDLGFNILWTFYHDSPEMLKNT